MTWWWWYLWWWRRWREKWLNFTYTCTTVAAAATSQGRFFCGYKKCTHQDDDDHENSRVWIVDEGDFKYSYLPIYYFFCIFLLSAVCEPPHAICFIGKRIYKSIPVCCTNNNTGTSGVWKKVKQAWIKKWRWRSKDCRMSKQAKQFFLSLYYGEYKTWDDDGDDDDVRIVC